MELWLTRLVSFIGCVNLFPFHMVVEPGTTIPSIQIYRVFTFGAGKSGSSLLGLISPFVNKLFGMANAILALPSLGLDWSKLGIIR